MKYFPEVTEAIVWPPTRMEDNKTRMIPDSADFSWLWFARTTHNLFCGWKHFWFLSLPSNFEIYLLLGLWRVVIWRFFFHGHKNNGLLPLFDEKKYINNMFLLILIKRWYYLTRLEDHKTRIIPDNRLFLDFDLQKRQFVSWVETFLVFVTTLKIRNLLTWLWRIFSQKKK